MGRPKRAAAGKAEKPSPKKLLKNQLAVGDGLPEFELENDAGVTMKSADLVGGGDSLAARASTPHAAISASTRTARPAQPAALRPALVTGPPPRHRLPRPQAAACSPRCRSAHKRPARYRCRHTLPSAACAATTRR
jgi:hypothetical protein